MLAMQLIKIKFILSQTYVTVDHVGICLRETELIFNHLHSQHDLQLHMFERD
jgi:hypothetical protein